ncbi:unnamed protein product [Owenia fusiformis]|uniref:Globin domain-containing protein n=1 Tax=Owenia fusiformis TaxID=6347 RepID=A0A8S4NCQ3_OWEFU|nr:unnamed protein product [Owenia fusiformis]
MYDVIIEWAKLYYNSKEYCHAYVFCISLHFGRRQTVMSKLLVILALAVCAFVAVKADKCSQLQAMKVKTQWGEIYADDSENRAPVCVAIFRALFKKDPATKPLFSRVGSDDTNSPIFKAHCLRLLGGLDMTISLLDTPTVLEQTLIHLNEQHLARPGVKRIYFDAMGNVLDEILTLVYPPYDRNAWAPCWSTIVDGISKGLP